MKRTNFLLFFLGTGFLIMLGLFLLSNKEATNDDFRINIVEPQAIQFSQVISAPIPERVDFCGETINLDRMDIRERFDREMSSFMYLHGTTMLYLKRANRYFPVIEPILKINNIPDDFKYLCVIESNLDIRALSSASAAGLWQLLSSTGKENGLEISSEVDERYHIEKATEAACRYLRTAYSRYGSWVNASASYNAGMARISSSLSDQKVNSTLDLLLVTETSRYVFRILAIKQIFENPSLYGFFLNKENLYPYIPVQKVSIDRTIEDLATFSLEYGLNYLLLKEFNPWLRENKLTVRAGKTYILDIPKKEDLYYDPKITKIHDKRWVQ